ncbi:response regulator, partial [bacterium LRH843]|nr:response regulator [bacterium LRH843]
MRKQILLDDNQKKILKALTLALKDHQPEIITASSSKAALRFLEEKTIDLVILDLNISDEHSLSLIKEIRKNNAH